MTASQLSETDRAEIAARYKAGMSMRQLAKRFGVSEAAIRRALAHHPEVQSRPVGWGSRPIVDDDEIVRLRVEGLTFAAIGGRVGLSMWGARKRYLAATACRGEAQGGSG